MSKPSFLLYRAISCLLIPVVLGANALGADSNSAVSSRAGSIEVLSQDPFEDVERAFSPAENMPISVKYVNRNNSKIEYTVKLTDVTEFKCQSVEEFLKNEGVLVPYVISASGERTIKPTPEHKEILKSLKLSLFRIVNQKSQLDAIAEEGTSKKVYKVKFCIAEGTTEAGDVMTFAIPLERRSNGSFTVASTSTDNIVNIGGFSINMDNMDENSASQSAAKVLPNANLSEMTETPLNKNSGE